MAQITSKIELAFGANLTGNPASWVWTDVSVYALGSVSVTAGRADEASQTQPTRCTFRLANTDARFTPRFPTSPYYPNARRQTPVRVSLNPGTGYVQRFQGYIDVIEPTWPSGNSEVAEVSITASGILRRLSQGKKPLKSPLIRWHQRFGAVALWMFDDGSSATSAGSLTTYGQPMGISGSPTFGGTSSLGGTTATVSTNPGDVLAGDIVGVTGTGFIAFDIWVKLFTTSPANTQTFITGLNMSTGVIGSQLVAINNHPGPPGFQYVFTDVTGGLWTLDSGIGSPGSPVNPYDGGWHNVFVSMTQSGSNINTKLFVDGVQADSRTITSFTLSFPTRGAIYNRMSLGDTGNVGYAAYAVHTNSSVTPSYLAGLGYAGETADTRLTRLCAEEGVPLSVTGSSTTTMGPQGADTFMNLLRECETADIGILYDGAGPGLTYLCRPARYNQSVSLALDCKRLQVKLPFGPVEDDQRVGNDWTVSGKNGSPAHASDPVHIAANGLYDNSVTVNSAAGSNLADQARWRVNLGTVEDMRLPTLTFDPLHSPELQTQWVATLLGERVTAANLPTQYPFASADQVIEGYAEAWDSVTWSVTPNLSPYRPWDVFTIADSRLGRIQTDGSTLSSSVTTTGTSLLVASSGGLWDTGSTPFDIETEGEQITVGTVGNTVTDAFGRSAAGGWGTADTGQAWTVSDASVMSVTGTVGRIATATIGQLYLAWLDTGSPDHRASELVTLPVLPTGAPFTLRCIARVTDASNFYNATISIATSGVATLSLSKNVAGTGTPIGSSAVVGTHAAGNVWAIVLDVSGAVVQAKAWNATTGSDPNGFQVTVTDSGSMPPAGTNAGCGVRREASNTNGSQNIDFDSFAVLDPQTFTGTRSANGIVKAHNSGAAVKLWRPGVLAL